MSEQISNLEREITGFDLRDAIDQLFDTTYTDYVIHSEPLVPQGDVANSWEELRLALEEFDKSEHECIGDVRQVWLSRKTLTSNGVSNISIRKIDGHHLSFAESGLVWDHFIGFTSDYGVENNEDFCVEDYYSILKADQIAKFYKQLKTPDIQPLQEVEGRIEEARQMKMSNRIAKAFAALRPNNL